MKKLLILAAMIFVVANPLSTLAKDQVNNVNVVNEPTVNIGNSPEVTVNNDASNPASVTIENSTPIPVIINNESAYRRIPYSVDTGRIIDANSTGLICDITPNDLWDNYPEYNFVIEYISIMMWVEGNDSEMGYVSVKIGSSATYFASQDVVSPFQKGFIISQKTFMVLPYDEHLLVTPNKKNTNNGSRVEVAFNFNGYLVPQASPSLSR